MNNPHKNTRPLYVKTIAYDELFGIIPGEFAGYAIAECRDANYFKRWPDESGLVVSAGDKLERLDLFNGHHFIRFQRAGEKKYRLIADLEAVAPGAQSEPLAFFKERVSNIFLWGKPLGVDGYYESVIPKIFDYPAPAPTTEHSRLQLTVREFIDKFGNVVFYKYEGLQAAPEPHKRQAHGG